jgi:hypothetical protein
MEPRQHFLWCIVVAFEVEGVPARSADLERAEDLEVSLALGWYNLPKI